MKYQPKRSNKRWLESAPEYVLACYDNGGKTADRYVVLIGGLLLNDDLDKTRSVQYLAMSGSPEHPQGFSQWGEMPFMNRAVCGKKMRWLDLPENIRQHVVSRCQLD